MNMDFLRLFWVYMAINLGKNEEKEEERITHLKEVDCKWQHCLYILDKLF